MEDIIFEIYFLKVFLQFRKFGCDRNKLISIRITSSSPFVRTALEMRLLSLIFYFP